LVRYRASAKPEPFYLCLPDPLRDESFEELSLDDVSFEELSLVELSFDEDSFDEESFVPLSDFDFSSFFSFEDEDDESPLDPGEDDFLA
jgi:hypothetical protein